MKGRLPLWGSAKQATIGVAAISMLGLAAPVEAQSQIAQLPCNGSNNVEILQCLRLRYQEADRQLNRVYRQVTATLQPQEKQVLTDAQLVWIQFRDKSCNFETYRNCGGSGYSGFLTGCLERATRTRTAELERYLQQSR